MARIIDISPKLTSTLAVWPGDVPLTRQTALSFTQGHHLELSSLHATVHLGAHADAPLHYHAEGQDIAQRPLDLYYGDCLVLDVDVRRGERITASALPDGPLPPRVLFRTQTFPDPDQFNEDFAAFSPEIIDELARRGVHLVGIDTPSVDLFADKELLAHGRLYANDMAVLEGIVLTDVQPGRYTLVALPLGLVGFDASPVRAALVVA